LSYQEQNILFFLKILTLKIILQNFSLLVEMIIKFTLRNSLQFRIFEKNFYKMIEWKTAKEYEDITYKKCNGVARIAFNRPEVRNAFRPKTTSELYDAFYDASEDPSIGVVLLSGEGPSPKDGGWAFCSGGDQKARGHQGYVGEDGRHRLNILEVQRLIRFMPKVVIAVVPGWAVGGGHSLHVVCDLTLASEEHAIFKQTDADVTSFDGVTDLLTWQKW
jgi:naphthoate synthase